MAWLLILVLIVVGFLCLVLEILVIPGAGVAGVIGFILIAVGVWQGYVNYGSPLGHYILASTIAGGVLTLVFALRSKTWQKVMLKSEIDGQVNVFEESSVKIGDTGKTISRLVPAGKALINNEYFEVRTVGDFIDPDEEIVVTKIEFNKIYVKIKS